MSTVTEETTEVNRFQQVQNAVVTLDEQFAAASLHFDWAPGRKTVNSDQRRRAAEQFHAQASSVSASKKLLDTRHNTFVRAVEQVKRDARAQWTAMTLPYPQDGVRLINRDKLSEFEDRMRQYREQLIAAKNSLQQNRDAILSDARDRLGDLFNASDYPQDFTLAYSMSWGFPNTSPPEYLRDVDPAMYEAERAACRARLQEAVNAAEQEFSQRIYDLASRLGDALQPNPDGRRRALRTSTIDGLDAFFEQFDALNPLPGSDLAQQVDRLKAIVSGEDADSFRSMSEGEREGVAEQLDVVTQGLEELTVNAPRRRVVLPDVEAVQEPASVPEAAEQATEPPIVPMTAAELEADLEADGVIEPDSEPTPAPSAPFTAF